MLGSHKVFKERKKVEKTSVLIFGFIMKIRKFETTKKFIPSKIILSILRRENR